MDDSERRQRLLGLGLLRGLIDLEAMSSVAHAPDPLGELQRRGLLDASDATALHRALDEATSASGSQPSGGPALSDLPAWTRQLGVPDRGRGVGGPPVSFSAKAAEVPAAALPSVARGLGAAVGIPAKARMLLHIHLEGQVLAAVVHHDDEGDPAAHDSSWDPSGRMG